MPLTGLPHKVVTSFNDATRNWEYLVNAYQTITLPLNANSLTTAAPSQTINAGDSAVAGTSLSVLRSDAQFAVATAAAGTISPDAAAAEGSSTSLARADHTHAITTDTGSTLTGTNAEGSAATFARADHNHAFPNWGTYFGDRGPSGEASFAPGVANRQLNLLIPVFRAATITGITYRVGTTANGNVRSAFYDSTGARVANRTTSLAQAAAGNIQQIAFDSTYAAAPGIYFGSIIFSSATGTCRGGRFLIPCSASNEASFVTATSIAAPTTSANVDICQVTTY